MKRRILAWVLLAGFLLLLLNVMFIKFYWQLSMMVYLIIAFAFLFYNSRVRRMQEAERLIDGGAGKKDGTGKNTGSDNHTE